MLEHQKIVLQAVSGDMYLFEKELKKSLEWLNLDERKDLQSWVVNNFNSSHIKMIKDTFR
jgi:hypothetical protein